MTTSALIVSSPADPLLAKQLQQYAAAAEDAGRLLPDQLEIIYRQRWFKLFVPRSLGGLQLSLPEGLQIEEALAYIDGSLGWTVTLCSGATMFAGYLQPQVNSELFKDEKVCFGGSGRTGGTARVVEDGYLISGHWPYATGAPHTTIFTANCFIEKEGKRVQNKAGNDLVQAFFFKQEEITLYEDWHTMGLKATAGHSFSVHNLKVAADRSFIIDAAHATIDQPLYHYPFVAFAEATIAVNTAGMATRFFELCAGIFNKREEQGKGVTKGQHLLAQAVAQLASLRQHFYETVGRSWQEQTETGSVAAGTLKLVSSASRSLASEARRLVDELSPWCGMLAADTTTEINRVWRDIHTASQHSLLLCH